MVSLKVYGTGCAKCNRLEANADAAARALGLDYTLEKITDRAAITDAGILITPALTVDGVVKVSGKAPSAEELQGVLKTA
ncbi:MAG: thioredoxin family protein [Rhodobacteraceae bacterium]|nr:MAG: thioredoxin family protein [Paracoccaceae bacterium]